MAKIRLRLLRRLENVKTRGLGDAVAPLREERGELLCKFNSLAIYYVGGVGVSSTGH